jgi:hypothetical protein
MFTDTCFGPEPIHSDRLAVIVICNSPNFAEYELLVLHTFSRK